MAPHGRFLPTSPVANRAATHLPDRGKRRRLLGRRRRPLPYQLSPTGSVRACVRPVRARPRPLSLTPGDSRSPATPLPSPPPTLGRWQPSFLLAGEKPIARPEAPFLLQTRAASWGSGRILVRGGALGGL